MKKITIASLAKMASLCKTDEEHEELRSFMLANVEPVAELFGVTVAVARDAFERSYGCAFGAAVAASVALRKTAARVAKAAARDTVAELAADDLARSAQRDGAALRLDATALLAPAIVASGADLLVVTYQDRDFAFPVAKLAEIARVNGRHGWTAEICLAEASPWLALRRGARGYRLRIRLNDAALARLFCIIPSVAAAA